MKYLFEEIIEISEIQVTLDKLDLNDDERYYLIELSRSSINHKVIDFLLTELVEEDRVSLLTDLTTEKEASLILQSLSLKLQNLEKTIIEIVTSSEKELILLISSSSINPNQINKPEQNKR